MKTIWIESTPNSWECGEPNCCYEAWTDYRITVDGAMHEMDDRHTSSSMLLPLLLPLLDYTNWRVEIDEREARSEAYDPAGRDAFEFVASNRWDDAHEKVLGCHLLCQSKGDVFVDQVYDTFPPEGVDDDQWLVTQFLAELGWHVEWR